MTALKRALSQVERQIREQRDRLRQRSRQPAPVAVTSPEEE